MGVSEWPLCKKTVHMLFQVDQLTLLLHDSGDWSYGYHSIVAFPLSPCSAETLIIGITSSY